MSNSASATVQQSASATGDISDALGSIGATESASATGSGSGSASATDSPSASASQSVAASQSLTDAPSLGTASADASATASVPVLSGAPQLTDLPTLSGYYSYPAPTVPPIQNAPYMQKNTLPENFVFIVVGACIGFVALMIIGWRILTSWSINRRFRRHEGGGGVGGKASYTPLADFKQKPPVSSSHDMKDLGHLPKNFSSVPSLFFSPTAEVARHSMRPSTATSDPRGHLPAGHYRDASRG